MRKPALEGATPPAASRSIFAPPTAGTAIRISSFARVPPAHTSSRGSPSISATSFPPFRRSQT